MLERRALTSTTRRDSKTNIASAYELLEPRRVLASLFPTWIDGQFTMGNGAGAAAPYDLADTFELESHPTATKTIYLDFDGHHSVNNNWNHDIIFPAFNHDSDPLSFSDAELIEIQLQFQNVAEDFLPFNVNVTTKDPGLEALTKSDASDQTYGIRSVNTQATDGFGNGIGGVAYLNSFDDSVDNPVFAFNKGENNGAMTNSHEVGHAVGLRHDGLGSKTYHPGVGSGETSWGPIMGAPFGENVTQWSNGDYIDSTNTEDDYSIIVQSQNGFGFRPDLIGNTLGSAANLEPDNSGDVFTWSIIERNFDTDMFRFETGGAVDLTVSAFGERPNLDILATIYDSSGGIVATSNPANGVDATFNLNIPAGNYYLGVEGTGKSGVYSDYGSIGFYAIDGNIEPGQLDPIIGETGHLNAVDENWMTVNLNHTYVDPVVIAGPSSRIGRDAGNLRVRNVTSDSFQIQFDEWEYLNGRHVNESVDYMVVESGQYTLSDGSILVADNLTNQRHTWKTYDFGGVYENYSKVPVVFSQIVTTNDPIAATTRISNVTKDGFNLKIKEEEAQNHIHGTETVSYVAIKQIIGTTGYLTFESGRTPVEVNQQVYSIGFTTTFGTTPAFFADMQTHKGGDTAVVRSRSMNENRARIYLEEEKSKDIEIRHNLESVGYMAIEIGFVRGYEISNAPPSALVIADGSSAELWEARRIMESWNETTLPLDLDLIHVEHMVQVDPAFDSTTFDSSEGIDRSDNRHGRFHQRFEALTQSVESRILAGSIERQDVVQDRMEMIFDELELEFDQIDDVIADIAVRS